MIRPRKRARASKSTARKAVETELGKLVDSQFVAGLKLSKSSTGSFVSEGAEVNHLDLTSNPLDVGDGRVRFIDGYRRSVALRNIIETQKPERRI